MSIVDVNFLSMYINYFVFQTFFQLGFVTYFIVEISVSNNVSLYGQLFCKKKIVVKGGRHANDNSSCSSCFFLLNL